MVGNNPVGYLPMDDTTDLVTVKELAKELRCSPDHVYRLARDGRIPSYRVGRAHRFKLAEVMEAIAQPIEGAV